MTTELENEQLEQDQNQIQEPTEGEIPAEEQDPTKGQEVQYNKGEKPKEYTKTIWKNEETKLNQDNLNAIENAIEENNKAIIKNYFNIEANHQEIEGQKELHRTEIEALNNIIDDLFNSENTTASVDDNGVVILKFGSEENIYKRLIELDLKSVLFTTNSIFTDSQKNAINSGITEGIKSSVEEHIADKENPHGVTTSQIGAVALTDIIKQGTGEINSNEENKLKVPSVYLFNEVLKTLVSIAEQTLTEEQKEQVRTNIGAAKNVGIDFITNSDEEKIGNKSKILFAKGFNIISNNEDNSVEIKVDFATAEMASNNKTKLLKIVSNYGMIMENNTGDVLYIPSIPSKTNRIRVVNSGHRFNEENEYEEIAYLSDIESEINKLSILSYEFIDSVDGIDLTRPNVIWMVKKPDKPNDPFDEYIIKNGEVKFIGTSLPSLNGYATEQWVREFFNGQDVIKNFNKLVGDIVSTRLENYVTNDRLENYPTKTDMNTSLTQIREDVGHSIANAKEEAMQWTRDQKYLQSKDLPTDHYIVPDGGIPNSDMHTPYIILNGQRVYLGEQYNIVTPRPVSLNIVPTENGYDIYSGYEGDEELALKGSIHNGSDGESIKSYRCIDDYYPTSATTRIDVGNFSDNIDDITIGSLIIANKNECNLYHVTNIMRDDNTHNIIYVNVEFCMSIKGDKGLKGDKGDEGLQGNDGKRGSRIVSVSTSSAWTGTNKSQEYSYYTENDMMEIDDCVINTLYGYVYKCVTAGIGTESKWKYVGSIRGPQGVRGYQGEPGINAAQLPGYGANYEIEEQLEEFLYKYVIAIAIMMYKRESPDFSQDDIGFKIILKNNVYIDVPMIIKSDVLENIFGGKRFSTLTSAFDEIAKQYTGILNYFSKLKLSNIKAIIFRKYNNDHDEIYTDIDYNTSFVNFDTLIPIFGHYDYYDVNDKWNQINISNHDNILGYNMWNQLDKILMNHNFNDENILFGQILINRENNGRVGITNTYNRIVGFPSSSDKTLYVYKNNNNDNIIFPSTYITEDDTLTIIDNTRGEKLKLKFGEVYISQKLDKFIGFYNSDYVESTSSENTNDITKDFLLGTFGINPDFDKNINDFDFNNENSSGAVFQMFKNGKYIISNDPNSNYWKNFKYFAINFGKVTLTKNKRIVLSDSLFNTAEMIYKETSMFMEAYQNGNGVTINAKNVVLNTQIMNSRNDCKMMLFSNANASDNCGLQSIQINVTDTEIEFKVVYY